MSFRDFDAERAERARTLTPIRFTLGGHEFTCHPIIPFGASVDLAVAPEPRANPAGAYQALRDFLVAAVDGDPHLITEAVRSVDVETLHDLADWLGQEYTGRPTAPSAASPSGPSAGGPDTNTDGPPRAADG